MIYKWKEEHAEGGDRKIKKREAKTEEEEREKQKNCIDYKKKKPIVVPALNLQYT